MEKYIMLIIGIGMLLGFIIYKLYKIFKYSVKIEARVIRNIDLPYDNYYGNDNCRSEPGFKGISRIPVYEYKYNELIYHFNNNISSPGGLKIGTIKKIRINPLKPEKAYISSDTLSFVYLFINFIVLLIGVLILFASNFSYKTAITIDDFKTISENNNYTVVDTIEQYTTDDYIKEIKVAKSSDEWKVEFYVLEDEIYAKEMFDTKKEIIKNLSKNILGSETMNKGNYSKYSVTSNDYYMYVSRIDNTLIYVKADKTYRDNVKMLIEELGY